MKYAIVTKSDRQFKNLTPYPNNMYFSLVYGKDSDKLQDGVVSDKKINENFLLMLPLKSISNIFICSSPSIVYSYEDIVYHDNEQFYNFVANNKSALSNIYPYGTYIKTISILKKMVERKDPKCLVHCAKLVGSLWNHYYTNEFLYPDLILDKWADIYNKAIKKQLDISILNKWIAELENFKICSYYKSLGMNMELFLEFKNIINEILKEG